MIVDCINFGFIRKQFFPSNSYALRDFTLSFFNFLIVFFVQLHKWWALFHGLLHDFELLSFFADFLILFHFLFNKLCVLPFSHLILNSSALSISTEPVVIRSDFFTTLVFEFSTITTLTTQERYWNLNYWSILYFFGG